MSDVRIKYKVDKGELVLARKELDKINKEIGVTKKQSNQASGAIKAVGGAIIAAFTIDKLIDFGRQVISVTAEFQKLRAVLTNTLGSRSAADQAFRNIQKFAANTPFQVNQITDSFVKLSNQGFIPTNKELTKLGDLAASTGKDFDQLTEAIIDAQVGEFERLKEFGIRASKEGDRVTFTFKGVQEQVDFTAESIQSYILGLGELQGVSGSMAAISETLGGKLSNLQDGIDSLFFEIGTKLNPAIGGAIDAMGAFIGMLTDFISVPYVENLREQQSEINTLAKSIIKLNEGEAVRESLITELNAKYPEFLASLSAEELTNENIAIRLAEVNKQFAKKLELEILDIALQDKKQKAGELLRREIQLRKELTQIEEAEQKVKDGTATFDDKLIAAADLKAVKQAALNKVQAEGLEIREEILAKEKEIEDQYQSGVELEFFEQREKNNKESVESIKEKQKELETIRETDLSNEEENAKKRTEFILSNDRAEKAELLKEERKLQEQRIKLEEEANMARLQSALILFDALSKFLQDGSAEAKAFAIFQIGISTAEAIAKGTAASQNVPFPGNLIATATTIATVLSNIAQAKQILFASKFAEGVINLEGGVKGKDSIPALLMPGESVMTTAETRNFMPTLKAIRENSIDPEVLNQVAQGKGSHVHNNIVEVPRDQFVWDEDGFSYYMNRKNITVQRKGVRYKC